MSNAANTKLVAELFALPQEQRDDVWFERFFTAVPDAPLQLLDPQVELGPDGYPYFQLAIPASDETDLCTLVQALEHCLDRGLGVVIFRNPDRTGEPGWVFPYAQLFSYSLFRNFFGDPNEPPEVRPLEPASNKERQILLMQPSESFLPLRVRRALTTFFRNVVGIAHPKMLMIVEPDQRPPNGLMFNLSAKDFDGDEEKYGRALNALHWYLPTSYCAVLKKPPDWGEESFQPLSPD
jgi:hypothetical protein